MHKTLHDFSLLQPQITLTFSFYFSNWKWKQRHTGIWSNIARLQMNGFPGPQPPSSPIHFLPGLPPISVSSSTEAVAQAQRSFLHFWSSDACFFPPSPAMASTDGAAGLSTWYYIIETCSQKPGIYFQFYLLDYILVDYLHKDHYTLAPTCFLLCSLKHHHDAVPHPLCYKCSSNDVQVGRGLNNPFIPFHKCKPQHPFWKQTLINKHFGLLWSSTEESWEGEHT